MKRAATGLRSVYLAMERLPTNTNLPNRSLPGTKRSHALAAQQASSPESFPSSSKVPRVDARFAPSPFSSSRRTLEKNPSPARSSSLGPRKGSSSNSGRFGGPAPSRRSGKPKLHLPGPFHDEAYVTKLHHQAATPIPARFLEAPKSALANFTNISYGQGVQPTYGSQSGTLEGGRNQAIWR
jgi:hypothetical protein